MNEAVQEWWDDFIDVWRLFNPTFRERWLSEQRDGLNDADMIIGGGGNFDGAGTGGQD